MRAKREIENKLEARKTALRALLEMKPSKSSDRGSTSLNVQRRNIDETNINE